MATKKRKRSSTATSTATSAVAAVTIATKYVFQICYLKDVHNYMKYPANRAAKIKWLVQEKFNEVLMYGVDGIISASSYWPYLRAFITELRAAGIKYVGLAYSNSTVVPFLNSFQDTGTAKFDRLISEIEPWVSTSGISWAEYQNRISAVRTWANSEPVPVTAMTYQGWANKPTGTNFAANCNATLRNVNIVCLHNYVYPAPSLTYQESRYKQYALEAYNLGFSATKKAVLLNIYSAEQEFSQTGFKTKSPQSYNDDIVAHFNALSFPHKECLDWTQGFLVFKDTDLEVVRPLKV